MNVYNLSPKSDLFVQEEYIRRSQSRDAKGIVRELSYWQANYINLSDITKKRSYPAGVTDLECDTK